MIDVLRTNLTVAHAQAPISTLLAGWQAAGGPEIVAAEAAAGFEERVMLGGFRVFSSVGATHRRVLSQLAC